MSPLLSSLRPEALNAPASGIVEIANRARAKGGVIQLWVGEGDEPTPTFIREAAKGSLDAGETCYTHQRGIPELREAIAAYSTGLYGRQITADRITVTGSGMQALQTAFTLVAGPGDEVIVPSPAWPNSPAAAELRGAKTVAVPLTHGNKGWTLDLDRMAEAITPRTRALFINTPCNPTGWTATHDDLRALLALARTHGLWIIADEIYTRFYWRGDAPRAPSFHDIREDGDKIIFINTFSKNWAMTGWRAGWIEADPSVGETIGKLVQFSTSGVPVFVQRAAVTALEQGEPFVAYQIEKARAAREALCDTMEKAGIFRFSRPDGAFYLFFSVDGIADTRQFAFDLVDKASVGIAPGTAFGAGGELGLRLCYLRSLAEIQETCERLSAFAQQQ